MQDNQTTIWTDMDEYTITRQIKKDRKERAKPDLAQLGIARIHETSSASLRVCLGLDHHEWRVSLQKFRAKAVRGW